MTTPGGAVRGAGRSVTAITTIFANDTVNTIKSKACIDPEFMTMLRTNPSQAVLGTGLTTGDIDSLQNWAKSSKPCPPS
jgi:hypothetical protein